MRVEHCNPYLLVDVAMLSNHTSIMSSLLMCDFRLSFIVVFFSICLYDLLHVLFVDVFFSEHN